MNRGYTIEEFKSLINKIRGLKRKINITSDMIVGYTDETKDDFQASLDLIEYCKFTQVFIGKYSVRPGTYAAKHFEDNISKEIKEYRYMKMDRFFREIAKKDNLTEFGRETEMFVSYIKNGVARGYLDNMKNIIVNLEKKTSKKDFFVGDFINVKITGNDGLILKGEIL